ncbi:MAG: hypothetical protein ACRD2L_23565, partial [Terriglobia bacterium]
MTGAVLVLCSFLSSQGQSGNRPDHLAELIKLLSSTHVEAREEAEKELRNLPSSRLSTIRSFLDSAKEGEVRLRLQRVVAYLLTKKAGELYNSGLLREALLAYAEAGAPSDPKGFMKERLDEAKKEIYSWLPSDRISFPTLQYDLLAKQIGPHGPWGIAALIDMLRIQDAVNWHRTQASRILSKMGRDVSPALLDVIKDEHESVRANACMLLG